MQTDKNTLNAITRYSFSITQKRMMDFSLTERIVGVDHFLLTIDQLFLEIMQSASHIYTLDNRENQFYFMEMHLL